MTQTEALRLALEALDPVSTYGRVGSRDVDTAKAQAAITAIKAALEAKDEPVTGKRLELIGHADLGINNIYIFNGYGEEVPEGRTPLYAGYTTPPQRTWVGLTDEEIFDVWLNETPAPDKVFYQKLCRSIEFKLRSKNYD